MFLQRSTRKSRVSHPKVGSMRALTPVKQQSDFWMKSSDQSQYQKCYFVSWYLGRLCKYVKGTFITSEYSQFSFQISYLMSLRNNHIRRPVKIQNNCPLLLLTEFEITTQAPPSSSILKYHCIRHQLPTFREQSKLYVNSCILR